MAYLRSRKSILPTILLLSLLVPAFAIPTSSATYVGGEATVTPLQPVLTVSTDRASYTPHETVRVYGTLKSPVGKPISDVWVDIEHNLPGYWIMIVQAAKTDSNGGFTYSLTVPSDAPSGTYTILAKYGEVTVSATFSVISLTPTPTPTATLGPIPEREFAVRRAEGYEVGVYSPRHISLSTPYDRKPAAFDVYLKRTEPAIYGLFSIDFEAGAKVRAPMDVKLALYLFVDVDAELSGSSLPDIFEFEYPIYGIPSGVVSIDKGDLGVYAFVTPVKPAEAELEQLALNEWVHVGTYNVYAVQETSLMVSGLAYEDVIIGPVLCEVSGTSVIPTPTLTPLATPVMSDITLSPGSVTVTVTTTSTPTPTATPTPTETPTTTLTPTPKPTETPVPTPPPSIPLEAVYGIVVAIIAVGGVLVYLRRAHFRRS